MYTFLRINKCILTYTWTAGSEIQLPPRRAVGGGRVARIEGGVYREADSWCKALPADSFGVKVLLWCRVLQSVAVWCSVLHFVVVCCRVFFGVLLDGFLCCHISLTQAPTWAVENAFYSQHTDSLSLCTFACVCVCLCVCVNSEIHTLRV